MSHYKSNLRDIEFNLFEVFGRQELLGVGPFAEVDEETARDMLAEVNRLATGPVAESFADADRNPPVFDPATGNVTMPESFKKSYRALLDAEWWRLSVPPELGGTVVPKSLSWAAASFILGANPAAWMFSNGPAFATVLWTLGTPEQKRFAELAGEREWGATMVLTEPEAGSDVGAGRTKAIEQPDGSWHIEGVKRFITNGDQDMTENIFHLVLARHQGPVHVPGAEVPGERGRLARRAERRPRHQPRAQDGPQGLDHVRADVRRRSWPARGRLPGRRRARRHQADVHGHRARADAGRQQGDRDPVHRLPQRARVRQEPRPGPGPGQAVRQDLAPGDDHQPPGRAPDAHAAEGVRGGAAGAHALHGHAAGRGAARGRQRRAGRGRGRSQRPAAAPGQGGGLRARVRDAHALTADARRLRVPAGLPDRAVHQGREDRLPV